MHSRNHKLPALLCGRKWLSCRNLYQYGDIAGVLYRNHITHAISWFPMVPEPIDENADVVTEMAYGLKTKAGRRDIWQTQVHSRTGLRHHQGRHGLSAISSQRGGIGKRRVKPRLHGAHICE